MNDKAKPIKILLSGGGTMGSVTPLLAIYDYCQKLKRPHQFYFIGTKTGPEKLVVTAEGINFFAIATAKWRRYWSVKNFIDLGNFCLACLQSFWLILRLRPSVMITAGSFVSVPLAAACFIWRVPIIAHQLDYQPGLANRLIAKLSRVISVTFTSSLEDYGSKAVWVGSLIRQNLMEAPDQAAAKEYFDFAPDYPVILVLGGGTGAALLNQLLIAALPELLRCCQILHLTGVGKGNELRAPGYLQFAFLQNQEMAAAYSAADLVISRAGMGVLTELSYLGKPSLILPIKNSHQEMNARALASGQAIIALDETKLDPAELVTIVQELIYHQKLLSQLSKNIQIAFKSSGAQQLVRIIEQQAGWTAED